MWIFEAAIVAIGLLTAYRAVHYARIPRQHPGRMSAFMQIIFLLVVAGVTAFAWKTALLKDVLLSGSTAVYPSAQIDVLHTAIFTSDQYWTYTTSDAKDAVFNWYRARAGSAGWSVVVDDVEHPMAFVIPTHMAGTSTPLVLMIDDSGGKTRMTYTGKGGAVITRTR